jgi:xylan 1,4-beta-xylosidase
MKITFYTYAVIFFGLISAGDLSGQNTEFVNPVLAGFYPDPSVCRVDSEYFLVNSTFSYFPGIPVSKSIDLVHWKLIGYVMNRPEQIKLDGLGVSRGIFAPAIRYNKGTFYVTCTLVDAGGNFIVTSKKPEGPWSNPVWIPQINGIDPSMFFDTNGKSYIVYNSIPPGNVSLYGGHRTIRMYEFDIDSLKVRGEEKILINGGTDITKKPVWIEGPHIFQKDGYYYLIAAEGGTSVQHSEVVFRSRGIEGPYEPYKHNPILTQRHLDPGRKNPITCTGHADFVTTVGGDWWSVFLGCRPYEDDFYNTGRETFLAPVKWKDGWPVITEGNEEVQYRYPIPVGHIRGGEKTSYGGNFQYKDEFDKKQLEPDWMFLRTPHKNWYDLESEPGHLVLHLTGETCAGNMNPAFLGRRQQHLKFSAGTSMRFSPGTENEKAGLLIFQNEEHFYFLCKSVENGVPKVQLFKSADRGRSDKQMELMASRNITGKNSAGWIFLKIEANKDLYSFSFASESGRFEVLKDSVDARFLSTKVAGGFVGCMIAVYATSLGEPSSNKASFDWFEYRGDDEFEN